MKCGPSQKIKLNKSNESFEHFMSNRKKETSTAGETLSWINVNVLNLARFHTMSDHNYSKK